jgi:hypothetical protein
VRSSDEYASAMALRAGGLNNCEIARAAGLREKLFATGAPHERAQRVDRPPCVGGADG